MYFYVYYLLQYLVTQLCFKVLALAKQLDWSERQVERWLRLRRSQDKPSTLTKFCESWLVIVLNHCFTAYINITLTKHRICVRSSFQLEMFLLYLFILLWPCYPMG